MSGWLRIALALQMAFFALWAGSLLTSHRDAGVVWLETEPVDPRDLLSGHYVALRYVVATPAGAGCQAGPGEAVWVQLSPSGETVATTDGMVPIHGAVDCRRVPPVETAGQVWMTGRIDDRPGGGRITYGIERMFVAEESPLRVAQSGTIVARIAVNDAFEPRLLGVVSKRAPTEAPDVTE